VNSYFLTAIKEPISHFLLLGACLFGLYGAINNNESVDNRLEIVVSETDVQRLIDNWEGVWNRSPSQTEINGLVESYIREEVLYREALAIGLDKGDGIVRRRLQQKMEFISEDIVAINPPSEKILQKYLDDHVSSYRLPDKYSFTQVYLNPNKRESSLEDDSNNLLKHLNNSEPNYPALGDPIMLGHHFKEESERNIERQFGGQFLQGLQALEPGAWKGPIQSGFGTHLVRIEKYLSGKTPELANVRAAVERDWTAAERRKTNEAFYQSLRQRYTVKIIHKEGRESGENKAPGSSDDQRVAFVLNEEGNE